MRKAQEGWRVGDEGRRRGAEKAAKTKGEGWNFCDSGI